MTELASNNSLLQRLQQLAPELLPACERVPLKVGPWPAQSAAGDGCMYFPDDSLLGLSASSGAQQGVRLALLGCHNMWSPQLALSTGLQAEVLVPGHALRLSEARVRAVGPPLAYWWLQEAASAQQLMAQMAHMVFCAKHHSAVQNLASWLWLAQHHSPHSPLHIPVQPWRAWLAWTPEVWKSAWDTLESQQAVALVQPRPSRSGQTPPKPIGLDEWGEIQVQALASLSAWACPCHQPPPGY